MKSSEIECNNTISSSIIVMIQTDHRIRFQIP